jgi:hypothetical protein
MHENVRKHSEEEQQPEEEQQSDPESSRGNLMVGSFNSDSDWQALKALLEEWKAEMGPDHLLLRRYSRLLGDGPPRTREVFVERLLDCFGPHNSITKEHQRKLEMEKAALAEVAERNGEASSAGTEDGDTPLADVNPAESCGEVGRAEEAQRSDAQGDGTQWSDIGNDEFERMIWERRQRETRSSKPGENTWADLRNEPIYVCGMY